jgi:succinate dehydrogenase hydrophobic anchor subunit
VSISAIVIVVLTILLLGNLQKHQPHKTVSIVVTKATIWLQLTALAFVFVVLMLKGTFHFRW